MNDDDKKAFLGTFTRLVIATRPKEKPDAIEAKIYFDGLRDLEIEWVIEAADALARSAQFAFPKLADWRREVQRIHTERRAAQRAALRKLTTPLCELCDDTGVRRLEAGLTAGGRPAPRLSAPCPCQHQRHLELLGRVAPPALPAIASTSVDDSPLTHEESIALRASIPPMKLPMKPARTFARHTSGGAVAIAKQLVEQIARVEEAEHAAAEHARPDNEGEKRS
jgi:hypothetical protein